VGLEAVGEQTKAPSDHRVGQHAQAQLLLHDLPLGLEHVLVDDQPVHPLACAHSMGLQVRRGYGLDVVGEIGVVLALRVPPIPSISWFS
jgi:hypothetical protein